MSNGLIPIMTELYKIYGEINTQLLNGELTTVPLITLQSRGKRKGLLGWCSNAPIWVGDTLTTNGSGIELNICPEMLCESFEDVMETFLHETVHYYNAVNGILDCRQSQYHNKKFKEVAERLGLVVEKAGARGWASTSHSEKTMAFINSLNINRDVFNLSRLDIESKKSANQSMKYSCGCTTIRTNKEVEIQCLKCGNEFENLDE